MRLGRSAIRRAGLAAVAGAATLALSGVSASAHILEVDPPGNGDGKVGWVGGPLFDADAKGKGLIQGGPGGAFKMPPSHGKGLNTACESLRAHGNGVVDIYGPPPGPSGCPHGS